MTRTSWPGGRLRWFATTTSSPSTVLVSVYRPRPSVFTAIPRALPSWRVASARRSKPRACSSPRVADPCARFGREGSPQHLTDHRFRQLRAELDARRNFVGRQPIATVVAQFLLGGLPTVFQHYPGFRDLSLHRIGNAGHADLHHGG